MLLLSIEEKSLEMIKYGYIALKQFPKHERHGLASEIRSTMWSIQRLIVTAIKRYHKKTTLSNLDIELAVLRRQVRISKDLRYIDIKRYQLWSSKIVEIGRMLGGWIKQTRASSRAAAL